MPSDDAVQNALKVLWLHFRLNHTDVLVASLGEGKLEVSFVISSGTKGAAIRAFAQGLLERPPDLQKITTITVRKEEIE